MSRIIIYNATILTLDEHDRFIYPGTIEIEGDRIAKIYAGSSGHDWHDDALTTILDGTDKLVMPGLVDLHFHTSIAKASISEIFIFQQDKSCNSSIIDSQNLLI